MPVSPGGLDQSVFTVIDNCVARLISMVVTQLALCSVTHEQIMILGRMCQRDSVTTVTAVISTHIQKITSPEFWYSSPVLRNQDTSYKHAPSHLSLSGLPFTSRNQDRPQYTNLCVSLPQTFRFFHRSCSPALPGFLQEITVTVTASKASGSGHPVLHSHLLVIPLLLAINTLFLFTYFSRICFTTYLCVF